MKPLFSDYNISEDLATYMLYPLDNSISLFTSFFASTLGEPYLDMLAGLEEQLQSVMRENGFADMLELYRAVAVR